MSKKTTKLSKAVEKKDKKKSKILLIKFLAGFVAIVSTYYILLKTGLSEGFLESFSSFNAWLSVIVLNVFGEDAVQSGIMLSSPRFMLTIGVGCEGSEPLVLFLAALIAFPLAWKFKWQGIVAGSLILIVLNVLRIVALYYIGIHWHSMFEQFHTEIFPIIFIIFAMITWLIWINWAFNKSKLDKTA